MRRRFALILGHLLLGLLVGEVVEGRAEGPVIALFPTQNRAGDSAAAAVMDRTLRAELSRRGSLIAAEPTRNTLRRLRIRNGDLATPALLRSMGEELAADWLVSATLHDADRRLVPRLTMSARVYSSATGELVWAGFRGGSGIDRRKLLGLGTLADVETLVPVVVEALLRELPPETAGGEAARPRPQSATGSGLGKVAIVPFAGSTRRRATPHAETVTEAARARLFGSGLDLVSPNRAHDILRRLQSGRWGGVTVPTRDALHRAGADTILTGAVEAYDVGGSELEPEPRVTVAMRLLDAASGRILWASSLEREGWDAQGLFGRGRIYSRGALTERIVETLTKRLDRAGIQTTRQPEGR